MYLILGVVLTLAGAGMLTFGVLNSAFGLGNTLIEAGTTAITGGLILMALSEVVRQLRRLPEGPMAHVDAGMPPPVEDFSEPSLSLPPKPASSRIPFPPKLEPRPRAPAPVMPLESRVDLAPSIDAAEEPLDRPPPSFVRNVPEPRVIPDRGAAPLSPIEPRFASPEPRPGAKREEKDELSEGLLATAFSRLDVALRSTSPASEPDTKQNEMFGSAWPPDSRKASEVQPQPPAEAATSQHEAEPPVDETPSDEPYAVSILKSGVVDGMAYTLYSDGSIEAEMPQGTMRFASITELRAYLGQSS